MDKNHLILKTAIEEAKHPVFFGGAGVSTASGIPDFRGKGGISHSAPSEEILTPGFLHREPEAYYRFYRRYFMSKGHTPNACHKALAKLEAEGKLAGIITQNVDGLHQAAGSTKVLELHGSGQHFYCCDCQRPFAFQAVDAMPLVPRCPCGGLIRSKIVLYGEPLNAEVLQAATQMVQDSDLLIVGGTSLTVYPAAGLVRLQKKPKVLLINLTPTPADAMAFLVLHSPLEAVFQGFLD